MEDSWILNLLHSICFNVLLWLKHMKKNHLHTDKKLEKEGVFSSSF